MAWKPRHKFSAQMTERDGLKFRSKKEARFYDDLKLQQLAGDVMFFLRQPKFDLPGRVTYSADFIVFYSDGDCKIIDVKGFKTKDYIMKKKQVESLYPVEIVEI